MGVYILCIHLRRYLNTVFSAQKTPQSLYTILFNKAYHAYVLSHFIPLASIGNSLAGYSLAHMHDKQVPPRIFPNQVKLICPPLIGTSVHAG
jgi:hypothetical protein